jgi:hypothetical protein
MPIVKFLGRVLPSVVDVSFTDVPQMNWVVSELGITMDLSVHITKSIVEVDCDVTRYQDEYIVHLYMRAFDLARACVDMAAFSTGHSLTVVLDTFVKPDGTAGPLLFTDAALAAECTAFKMNPVTDDEKKAFGEVMRLVLIEPPLFMALNDLIQAISLPHHGPTNCARVLDGLRNLVAPGLEPKQGWPVFQSTVNADEAYLSFVTGHSKKPRHGDRTFIPGTITTDIAKRTWIVMNRFLEYRKRGNKPLPSAEFPWLKG